MTTISEKTLETFLAQYINTALWSSTDDDDDPLDGLYSAADISTATLASFRTDCQDFLEANASLIGDRIRQAGHDFWLTRNGHGCGFWDGDWQEDVGRRLTDASHVWGEVNLYVGDDGLIYS